MDLIAAHGLRMPRLGLGTYRMTGARCQAAVESALSPGYRHIDTARMYGNQAAVGDALTASGVTRADVHLTSKGHHGIQSPDRVRAACAESLRLSRTDYLDLWLLYWPRPGTDLPATLEAAIPKAGWPENQWANLEAMRLRLDDADRAAIAALPKTLRCVPAPFAPVGD